MWCQIRRTEPRYLSVCQGKLLIRITMIFFDCRYHDRGETIF